MNNAASHPAVSITVIDDDPELLKLIAMLLRRAGAVTDTFLSAQDALDHFKAHTPHMIILDLMMPGVDGFEILNWVRSTPRFDRVPVLILSAKVDPVNIRKSLDEGADAYITKPYIANSLIERVQTLLRTGRSPAAPSARSQRAKRS